MNEPGGSTSGTASSCFRVSVTLTLFPDEHLIASRLIHPPETMLKKITPCLWFDTQAEDAARFYISIFKNSKITAISHYPEAGQDVHGQSAGSVMTVAF